MGIYPKGHLMEFVRLDLSPQVMPAADVEYADEGDEVLLAGWPIARQHPRGEDSTVFRNHRGRDRRRADHSLATGLPPEPPPTGRPCPAGPGRSLTLGRHRQRRRLRRARHPPPRPHARCPRLALRDHRSSPILRFRPHLGGLAHYPANSISNGHPSSRRR